VAVEAGGVSVHVTEARATEMRNACPTESAQVTLADLANWTTLVGQWHKGGQVGPSRSAFPSI